MADVGQTAQDETIHDQVAGKFLEKMAAEIEEWLAGNTLSGASSGKRWVLTAVLPDGTQMTVHQLSARDHGLIKLTGEVSNGPGLLFLHVYSAQFLASYFVPHSNKPEEKREIGFHTGIGQDRKIEQ